MLRLKFVLCEVKNKYVRSLPSREPVQLMAIGSVNFLTELRNRIAKILN